MPHNHTRLYVGLAIAAVTIPAVGQYYYRAETDPYNAIRAERKEAKQTARENRHANTVLVSHQTRRGQDRDYLAEVRAALATKKPVPADYSNALVYTPADLGNRSDQDAWNIDPYVAPEQMSMMEASPLDVAPYDEPTPDTPEDTADNAPPPPVEISDDRLVDLVMQNLQNDQERADFRAAWSTMSDDDRAALLDQWRGQLNGG